VTIIIGGREVGKMSDDDKTAKVFRCEQCGQEWIEPKNGSKYAASGFTDSSGSGCPAKNGGQHNYRYKCYLTK